MDIFDSPEELVAFASAILLLLLTAQRSLTDTAAADSSDEVSVEYEPMQNLDAPEAMDVDFIARAALHNFRVWNTFALLEEDLGYWVKPRSTAWFSRFLLNHYDNERWLQMFRFSKTTVHSMAELLRPALEKQNTKYRSAIPVLVRLACALFKLTHGASMLICTELFAVGRITVSMVLREVVQVVNVVLRSEITWPQGQCLLETESAFRRLCGMPGVVGAIDGTHIAILKPRFGALDYYYFKSGGYSMNCQAVVGSDKRFLDLFIGMPGSTNDSRMLCRSTLYHRALQNSLWDPRLSFDGFSPYLLGDGGYSLLPWLMIPHRHGARLPVAQRLYNKKLSRGRIVVENAFGLLKQTFRELHGKSDLNVCFLPDVITCCAILHNLLLRQSHADIERLLQILQTEGFRADDGQDNAALAFDSDSRGEDGELEGEVLESQKRQDLAVFLATHGSLTV